MNLNPIVNKSLFRLALLSSAFAMTRSAQAQSTAPNATVTAALKLRAASLARHRSDGADVAGADD